MSLSTNTEYLKTHGIRAAGGPLNGQIVDDGTLLWRVIKQAGGFYHLKGTADGGLEYVWAGVVAVDEGPTEGSPGDD